MLLVLYDSITVPLAFFSPPSHLITKTLSIASPIFWSMDIGFSFSTGFVKSDGGVQMDRSIVAKRYLRSWFFLDIVLVVMDWADIFLNEQRAAGMVRFSKAARTIRILRMIRLLRIVRMQRVLSLLSERIRSEKFILVANIMKIVVLVLGSAHVLACCWYGIGSAEHSSGRESWLGQPDDIEAQRLGYRYAISFHWTLAQISGLGSDEIHAQNLNERIFAIMVTFFSFAVASSVVSLLTSYMTQLHIMASTRSLHKNQLRRFLADQGISQDLSLRLQRNAEHRIKETEQHIPEEDVELLNIVSGPLRVELHFEIYSKLLAHHPFLRRYSEFHPEVMGKVCHCGISVKSLSKGDIVFSEGEIPAEPKMLFPSEGVLQYEKDAEYKDLQKGEWSSEATLWTHWMHRGTLRAKQESRVLLLDAVTFADMVSQFWTPEVNPKRYARDFVEGLNDMDPAFLSDLTVIGFEKEKRMTTESQVLQRGWSLTPRYIFGLVPDGPTVPKRVCFAHGS